MTLVNLALGFAEKAPCATSDSVGNKQYTHICYAAVVPLWRDVTRGVHALRTNWSSVVVFGLLTAMLLSICALVVTAATAQTARGRPWDAAVFAVSPLLIFHAFSNWDLLAMAFTSGALWAWSARRPVLSGAMIGLGAAAKLYPIF